MRIKPIPLRLAVIIPFVVGLLLIVLGFLFLINNDYKYLAKAQGFKIVQTIGDATQLELKHLMTEPERITKIFAENVSREGYYKKENLIDIEKYTQNLFPALHNDIPQIAVFGYGDEQGRFVALRSNDAVDDYSLMLSDQRTDNTLVIYSGMDMTSEVIAEYDGYDPRVRPWYTVVKNDSTVRWSEIYVNYDDKMAATISSLTPVLDEKNKLAGVACFDIKLSSLNDYLQTNQYIGTGAIYIVDQDWNLVANSGNETTMAVVPGEPPSGKLLKAVESSNQLVKESSLYLADNTQIAYEPVQFTLAGSEHFILVTALHQSIGLNWNVVVVIPESDLMGYIRTRQNSFIIAILLISTLVVSLGLFALNRVVKPITVSTDAAISLSLGKWDTSLVSKQWAVKETANLVTAFNTMATNLKSSFDEIERLHDQETEKLEQLVHVRTEELKEALRELMDKEKLASLGSLVSGVAHEINTPLGVALTAASYLESTNRESKKLLLEENMTRSDFQHYMEVSEETSLIINTNLQRAAELIKSFKMISVNQNIEGKSTFDLSDYLQSVILSLKHEYKNSNIQIQIHSDQKCMINSYSSAYFQIFTNLIMNSITHGFKDKSTGAIDITLNKTEKELTVIYTDNGSGISQDIIHRIYEPFFTTNRNFGGSGLGLSIVYNIVTGTLGGKIVCESIPDKKTSFTINIPDE